MTTSQIFVMVLFLSSRGVSQISDGHHEEAVGFVAQDNGCCDVSLMIFLFFYFPEREPLFLLVVQAEESSC